MPEEIVTMNIYDTDIWQNLCHANLTLTDASARLMPLGEAAMMDLVIATPAKRAEMVDRLCRDIQLARQMLERYESELRKAVE